MPDSPVGPMITGSASRSPNSAIDWSRELVPFRGVRQEFPIGESRLVARPGDLVLGAAVAEIEHHARQAPPGELPQRRHAIPVPLQTTPSRRHRSAHRCNQPIGSQTRLASRKDDRSRDQRSSTRPQGAASEGLRGTRPVKRRLDAERRGGCQPRLGHAMARSRTVNEMLEIIPGRQPSKPSWTRKSWFVIWIARSTTRTRSG